MLWLCPETHVEPSMLSSYSHINFFRQCNAIHMRKQIHNLLPDKLLHRALFLNSRFTNHQHGRDQVENCPIGQPFTKKVRLFAGSVCPWPQGQAEVGGDQEHPGNTSHGPNKLKFGQTYYFYISKNRA